MFPKVLDTILGSKSGTDGTVAYDTRIRPQVTNQSHQKIVNPYMHRLESVTCPVKIGIHKNHPINSKVLPILFSMPKKSFIVEILVSGHFSHRLTMPPNIIYIFKCLCESNSKYHPKHVKGFDPATNMTDTASPTFVNVNIYLR